MKDEGGGMKAENTTLKPKGHRFAATAALLLAASLMVVSRATAAPKDFVTRSGTQFQLNGKPFRVGGTTVHYLGWGTRAEVDAALEDARAMKFNVVRSILHAVVAAPDGSVPSIWNHRSTGDSSNMGVHGTYLLYWDTAKQGWAWNDSTVNGLGRWDYVLVKARAEGLKLDISLMDFWQWAGGSQQVNAWWGLKERYTSFYTDARAKAFYKAWVSHVLNRVNSINGIRYKDDPTIFAWDLMNEPEVSSVPLAQGWFREMSAHVKSIDPNHLLCTGSEGFYGGRGGSEPDTELALPDIDFGTWHTYPAYHDIKPEQVLDLIRQHGETAARAKKPVLMQEFGYNRKNADQPEVYRKWLEAVKNDPNCAGWVSWRLESRVVPAPTRAFPEAEKDALGKVPPDNGEGFGYYNDGSAVSKVLSEAAVGITAGNK